MTDWCLATPRHLCGCLGAQGSAATMWSSLPHASGGDATVQGARPRSIASVMPHLAPQGDSRSVVAASVRKTFALSSGPKEPVRARVQLHHGK